MAHAPSLRNFNQTRMVDVVCSNNGKSVRARVISQDRGRLVVTLPGDQEVTMLPNPSKPGMYVARMAGLEFTCVPGVARP